MVQYLNPLCRVRYAEAKQSIPSTVLYQKSPSNEKVRSAHCPVPQIVTCNLNPSLEEQEPSSYDLKQSTVQHSEVLLPLVIAVGLWHWSTSCRVGNTLLVRAPNDHHSGPWRRGCIYHHLVPDTLHPHHDYFASPSHALRRKVTTVGLAVGSC